ncbi:MAG: hypothetical protein ACFFCO_02530 [Promethearchaeota archaeon]
MPQESHSHDVTEPTEKPGKDRPHISVRVRETGCKEHVITKVGEASYEIVERLQQMSISQLTHLAEYRNEEAIQQLPLPKSKGEAKLGAATDRPGLPDRISETERFPSAFKGIIREYARYFLRERLQEDLRRYDLTDAKSPILRAADNPELRKTLLPQPGSRLVDVSSDLLSLVKKAPDPTQFTQILDYETYLSALQAFPLLQLNPHFDELHRHVKFYFQLRSFKDSGISIPTGVLTEYTGLSDTHIHTLLRDKPPLLISRLLGRARYVFKVRERIRSNGGIESVQDVKQRLKTFVLGHHITSHPSYSKWMKHAERHFRHLRLAKAGYHPLELGLYRIEGRGLVSGVTAKTWNASGIIENRPYPVHVAASVPETPPELDCYWLPAISLPIGQSSLTNSSQWANFIGWIQVPLLVASLEQLDKVLAQISPPTFERLQSFSINPQEYSEWESRFGALLTPGQRRLAIAYLIGVSLSDGSIWAGSNLSSVFTIGLSSMSRQGPAPWSKDFGDLVAYYWTHFGILTKAGEDILPGTRGDGSLKGMTQSPVNLTHRWKSNSSLFLTWFNEAILRLPPRGSHTEHCSKADWILQTDKAFRTKVLQGLFDGDGWVTFGVRSQVGIASEAQGELVESLLRSVGIQSIRDRSESSCFNLIINAKDMIRLSYDLPLFHSATVKQELLEKVVQMQASTLPPTVKIQDLPLVRFIQDAAELGKSVKEIWTEVYERVGISLSGEGIQKIIREGAERLRIDRGVVKAYTQLLKLQLSCPQESIPTLARRVIEETGVDRSIDTYRIWAKGKRVPIDVKRAISINHPSIDDVLLKAYPHLHKYKSLLEWKCADSGSPPR